MRKRHVVAATMATNRRGRSCHDSHSPERLQPEGSVHPVHHSRHNSPAQHCVCCHCCSCCSCCCCCSSCHCHCCAAPAAVAVVVWHAKPQASACLSRTRSPAHSARESSLAGSSSLRNVGQNPPTCCAVTAKVTVTWYRSRYCSTFLSCLSTTGVARDRQRSDLERSPFSCCPAIKSTDYRIL